MNAHVETCAMAVRARSSQSGGWRRRKGANGSGDPLAIILADHDAQRQMCERLRAIAHAGFLGAEDARALHKHLKEHLPRHHRDEDEALFPLLRERALPEDGLDEVLARLHRDHVYSSRAADEFMPIFAPLSSDQTRAIDLETSAKILRFVGRELRHLAIENAVVLVIAQVRLSKADLAQIARRMSGGATGEP